MRESWSWEKKKSVPTRESRTWTEDKSLLVICTIWKTIRLIWLTLIIILRSLSKTLTEINLTRDVVSKLITFIRIWTLSLTGTSLKLHLWRGNKSKMKRTFSRIDMLTICRSRINTSKEKNNGLGLSQLWILIRMSTTLTPKINTLVELVIEILNRNKLRATLKSLRLKRTLWLASFKRLTKTKEKWFKPYTKQMLRVQLNQLTQRPKSKISSSSENGIL